MQGTLCEYHDEAYTSALVKTSTLAHHKKNAFPSSIDSQEH